MQKNISFQSKYRAVSKFQFDKLTDRLGQKVYVKDPWSINESVKAKSAYTRDGQICTICGFVDKKESKENEVFLLHLCPTFFSNFDFDKIKNFILKNINIQSKQLHATLIGADSEHYISKEFYNKFKNFLDSLKIPYSEFKYGKGDVDAAYDGDKDEWLITSFPIEVATYETKSTKEIFDIGFEEVRLSEVDVFA